MAPRPEYEKLAAGGNYSSTSDDDCAKLVKPGQLDTFNRQRNEKIRQRLAEIKASFDQAETTLEPTRKVEKEPTNSSYYNNSSGFVGYASLSGGDSIISKLTGSEDRGRTGFRPILQAGNRRARSCSKDAIKIGNRVIVKEKYLGTCRYVGPIQEKYISPEIFIGVELDEPLTNNSGVFGSRQYFTCPQGHGLMVPTSKVRKIKTTSFEMDDNHESAGKVKRSKSVADLSRMLRTQNWFAEEEDRQVSTKVSTGYKSLQRSKSSSNVSHFAHPINDADPRDLLNQIKRYQPNLAAGMDYPVNPYGGYHPGAQTLPNLRQLQRQDQNPYGLPLQYPGQASAFQEEKRFPYSDDDLLRKSFARIVTTSATPPPMQHHMSTPHMPYAVNYAGSLPGSSGYASSQYNQQIYDVQSDGGYQMPHREPDIRRYNSLPPKHHLLSESSRQPSFDEYQKNLLQSYPVINQPLCATCAACQTCGPSRLSQLNNIASNHELELLQHRQKQELHEREQHEREKQRQYQHELEEKQRQYQQDMEEKQRRYRIELENQQELDQQHQLIRELQEKQIREQQRKSMSSADSMPDLSQLNLNQEYEKWKARHGLSMGRGMKKGLSKLQHASNTLC